MHGSPALTLSLAAALGVTLTALAHRVRLPSIALLLVGGVGLGTSGLGWIRPDELGDLLSLVIQVAVAVILFEGGLTLDLAGLRRAPRAIGRMLTVGVLITWLGSAAALWYVMGLDPMVALLGGSLVIVTGPTVVSPLLRRLNVHDKLYHVLYWEGVLIDAVGVFAAVLCLEWVTAGSGFLSPIVNFGMRNVLGIAAGAVGGLVLAEILRFELIPTDQINTFVLSFAVLLFAACDAVLHESGILTVIVAGLVVGFRKPPSLRRVKRFKLELTELAIGVLFVLLSARLEIERFFELWDQLIVLLAILMLVLRPLVIVVATWKEDFNWRERLFLSWIGPRGIVAAAMASLVSISLADQGLAGGDVLETFVFAVIGATVIVQGLTAPLVVWALGLRKPPHHTWLLLGNETVTSALGDALSRAGISAVSVAQGGATTDVEHLVIDSDPHDPDLTLHPALGEVGWVLAVYSNPQVNRLLCRMWAPIVGRDRCLRWSDPTSVQTASGRPSSRPVWTDLPPPTTLAAWLAQGQVRFESVGSGVTAAVLTEDRPLFAIEGSEARALDFADEVPKGPLVLIRRPIPHLAGLVQGAFLYPKKRLSLGDVTRCLLEEAAGSLSIDVDRTVAEIIQREETMSAMGLGIAIPHAYCEGATSPICLLGVVPRGLVLEDGLVSDETVHLVFLILSPPQAQASHLRSLAAVAHISVDTKLRDAIIDAPSPEVALALVKLRE